MGTKKPPSSAKYVTRVRPPPPPGERGGTHLLCQYSSQPLYLLILVIELRKRTTHVSDWNSYQSQGDETYRFTVIGTDTTGIISPVSVSVLYRFTVKDTDTTGIISPVSVSVLYRFTVNGTDTTGIILPVSVSVLYCFTVNDTNTTGIIRPVSVSVLYRFTVNGTDTTGIISPGSVSVSYRFTVSDTDTTGIISSVPVAILYRFVLTYATPSIFSYTCSPSHAAILERISIVHFQYIAVLFGFARLGYIFVTEVLLVIFGKKQTVMKKEMF